MPTLTKKVFLSSTFLDLREYRDAAVHACQRVGLLPIYMEDFPPDPRDAIAVCRAKVEEADLFLGIYAHRYGYVPAGSDISITEMEYDWARERSLPVHLFVADPEQPWPPSQVDKGRDYERLTVFKERIGKTHTLKKFWDVPTFKEDVLLLVHDLARTETAAPAGDTPQTRRTLPIPPTMHSVPPYILTNRFIGRRKELDALDTWARSTDPMLVVEAIGGVGKSALTWEWARERAKKVIPDLAGILWWSFYEGGASTASFVREALAYVTEADPEDLRSVPKEEQLQKLLLELRRRPYLLVLDGFERLLTAYHRLDPSKLRDDQVESDLRACTDLRTEDLLRQLIAASPSKVLVTTRLMPSALENRAHQPLPGVRHQKLAGLEPADGEDLLRSMGVHGKSPSIRGFLRKFDNHSLLIGVLAGRILDYRPSPGDFDRWVTDPKEGGSLHLSELDLKQRRAHILDYSLEGLDPKERQLLSRIAVLSDAADYATLSHLSPYLPLLSYQVAPSSESLDDLAAEFELRHLHPNLGTGHVQALTKKAASIGIDWFRREHERRETSHEVYLEHLRRASLMLDNALGTLENRGLLQWDRDSNTYDLHPVIRGYAFDQLKEAERANAYERIRDHFENLPPEDTEAATELADLKVTIQIYRALLGLGQLDRAAELYRKHLSNPLLFSITSYPIVIELLSPIFRNGLDHPPILNSENNQVHIVNDLGLALSGIGNYEASLGLCRAHIQITLESNDWVNLGIGLRNYSVSLSNQNRPAESFCALNLSQELSEAAEAEDLLTRTYLSFAVLLHHGGRWEEAQAAYQQFVARPTPMRVYYRIGDAETQLCWMRFLQGLITVQELDEALTITIRERNLESQRKLYCIKAEKFLAEGLLRDAVEEAENALQIARKMDVSDRYAQGCLARAWALQGRHAEALRMVEDGSVHVWQAAEVYLEVGDHDQAKQLALRAYEKAWADGPPHIWWWALERSKKVLAQLGVPEPELPPFDPAKVEPIPFEKEIRQVIEELKAEKAVKAKEKTRTPGGTKSKSRARRAADS
jgi:tetratricopeptide (TPR) repeat protein